MQPSSPVFRQPRWIAAGLALMTVACVAGAVAFAGDGGEAWWAIGLALLAVLFAAGVADAVTTRVELHEDSLEIVSNFRRSVVARSELRRVVAEKGAPVSIERASGGWVRLPAAAGPHPNTLRAWLRRGEGARD